MYFGSPLAFLPISDVGFLHDSGDYQTKQPIVYDIQEPFRWIADAAVMESFESAVLDFAGFLLHR